MNIIKMGMTACILLLVVGCETAVTNRPSSNVIISEEFPSYKVDQPIDKQVEVVVPIGNGTTKKVVEHRVNSENGENRISTLKTTTYWEIDSQHEQISTKLHTITSVSKPGERDYKFDVDEELLSNKDGKVIGYHLDLKEFESLFSPIIIEMVKKVQPQWITQEYHLDELGTKITTGYEIRPTILSKERLQQFLGAEMSSKVDQPEIVKGYGTYNNKRVVVTYYTVDEVVLDGNSTMVIKGKGYNLYDARSFIHVRGEFLIRINVTDNDGKVQDIEVRIKQRCDDYHVRGLINAPGYLK
ncbi:hypothetical protein [Desulfopila sp. IMCC35008]|uniref:hypothetical protein n=1 Tax=Desulfopila sp. IMCC35008 TaxID=2653858 RepID=UPI0013D0744C|nr:hypothetical protein [Desulfopila sp. IMCC35008]